MSWICAIFKTCKCDILLKETPVSALFLSGLFVCSVCVCMPQIHFTKCSHSTGSSCPETTLVFSAKLEASSWTRLGGKKHLKMMGCITLWHFSSLQLSSELYIYRGQNIGQVFAGVPDTYFSTVKGKGQQCQRVCRNCYTEHYMTASFPPSLWFFYYYYFGPPYHAVGTYIDEGWNAVPNHCRAPPMLIDCIFKHNTFS